MENDVAAGEGGEEGVEVGDVAVNEFKGGGGWREGGEVAGGTDQGANGVALF